MIWMYIVLSRLILWILNIFFVVYQKLTWNQNTRLRYQTFWVARLRCGLKVFLAHLYTHPQNASYLFSMHMSAIVKCILCANTTTTESLTHTLGLKCTGNDDPAKRGKKIPRKRETNRSANITRKIGNEYPLYNNTWRRPVDANQ